MAQREGSIYLYLFIGTFVLFAGALVAFFMKDATLNESLMREVKLKKEIEETKVASNKTATEYRELQVLLGGAEAPTAWPGKEIYEKKLNDVQEFINGKFKQLDNRAPKIYGNYSEPFTDLQDLITKILDSRKQAEERQKRAEEEKLASMTAAKEEAKKGAEIVAGLKTQLAETESKYEKKISEQSAQITQHEKDLAQVRDQLASAEIAAKRSDSVKVNLIASLQTRLDKLMEESRLTRTIDDVEPDGQVLEVAATGIGWVDIGRRSHLRPGIEFQVFQNVKGGKRQYKGRVEVQQVEESMGRFRILETTDDLNPIAKGDFITSPFFDAKAVPVFVFAGKGLDSKKVTEETLRQKIKGYGAQIQEKVDLSTSFLIALKDYDKEKEGQELFKQARDLGVPVLRERDILTFMGF
jgi:hypothetical protein